MKTIGEGANVFGLHVADGALVHADRHGALVIPDDVIDQLEGAIQTLLTAELTILNPARAGKMSFEDFEKAWAAFEAART